MRIGVNTRVLLKHRMEGVCRYMHEVLQRMVKAHPEDDFVFFFDRPYDASFIYGPNVKAVIVSPPTRHPALWYLWFEHQIPRYLKKYKIDVFYSPDTYNSLRTEVPSVIVSHDLAYRHFPDHIPKRTLKYYRKYFRRFHEKANKIVAVSESTKNDIIDQYGIVANKMKVGYNACPPDVQVFDESRKKQIRDQNAEGRPYFCYVGSIHPRKNVAQLLRAFDKFKETDNENYQLKIIGRMAWKTKDFQLVLDSLKYRNDVELTHADRSHLVEVLGASTALIYISLFEGFGIPLLEAMKSGVPVISSNLSSMAEVGKDSALLVDPTDLNEIVSAIQGMTKERVREHYIKRGLKRALDFSWDRTAEINYECIADSVRS